MNVVVALCLREAVTSESRQSMPFVYARGSARFRRRNSCRPTPPGTVENSALHASATRMLGRAFMCGEDRPAAGNVLHAFQGLSRPGSLQVSCVKSKQGSAEEQAAGNQRAAQVAEAHLKAVAEKSPLLLSDEERARRASEYAKAMEDKRAEAHAGQKLTPAEQELLLQQQLAALHGAPHDAMQAKLLAAMMGTAGSAESRLGMEMKHAGEEGLSAAAGASYGNLPMEDATGASSEAIRAAMERMLASGGGGARRASGVSTGAVVALVCLGLLGTALLAMIGWKYFGKNRTSGWRFHARMPFRRR